MIWIVKGHVTDPDAHSGECRVGDVEWQFSDGPAGKRSQSADYLSLEEGIRAHAGEQLIWDSSNDGRDEYLE